MSQAHTGVPSSNMFMFMQAPVRTPRNIEGGGTSQGRG